MVTYKTGERPRVGDIFTIYALDTSMAQDTKNQWKILSMDEGVDKYEYVSMNSTYGNVPFNNQRLSECKGWYLVSSGERKKSGFGNFITKIEAKPKKKPLPF